MTDFKQQLRNQLGFLERSCAAYDQGHTAEAVRLATTLRVLFHDTNSSVSLMNHLGAKSILILSTADVFNRPQALNIPLVYPAIELNTNGPVFHGCECHMRPRLHKTERKELIPLHTWWLKEDVIELNGGANKLNRRDLVLTAANKDGGAHVDAALEPTYDLARMGAGMSVEIHLKGGLPSVKVPFEDVHYASIRQIAYEVLNSRGVIALQ
jgi:hypothetical protein